jgi:1,4-dihydroxy-2-naphthoate polyprenyltransferase
VRYIVATPTEWVAGARPKTLTAAVAPVLVGSAIAAQLESFIAVRAALALGVALALQVGVNYANDYSDGIRGTDNSRVGPVRLVGQGRAPATHVRWAAFGAFGVAAILGFTLVALTQQWWLLLIGAISIAAGWFYTGGPRPYGYAGLGELFVLVFFGIVPVVGTAYVQTLYVTAPMFIAGAAIGLLSCAILIANNLRDIPTDIAAGKHTLATRLGDAGTRRLYLGSVATSYALVVVLAIMQGPIVLITFASALLAIAPMRDVRGGAQGRSLIAVLQRTSIVLLAFSILLALGFVIIKILSPL